MTKQEYLKALLGLQKFLKEHPEQRRVYSDIHVEEEILRMKYEVMKKKREEFHSRRLTENGWLYIDRDVFQD